MIGRLTMLLTLRRIRAAAPRGEDGQVNKTVAANWETFGTRRGDVKQESSSEGFAADEVAVTNLYSVRLRGDDVTRALSPDNRVEFTLAGRRITAELLGQPRVVSVNPPWLEADLREVI